MRLRCQSAQRRRSGCVLRPSPFVPSPSFAYRAVAQRRRKPVEESTVGCSSTPELLAASPERFVATRSDFRRFPTRRRPAAHLWPQRCPPEKALPFELLSLLPLAGRSPCASGRFTHTCLHGCRAVARVVRSCSGAEIRTPISGTKIRCPAIRRRRIAGPLLGTAFFPCRAAYATALQTQPGLGDPAC